MKIYFRATAYNADGDAFWFRFLNENWNGVEEAARAKLDEIVARDALHKRYGPWMIRNIDRTL